MKTILEEIYNSNIFPNELISDKNEEYKVANDTISDLLDKYKETFPNEIYQQVEHLLEILAEVRDIESSHTFCYGYKLATLIMMEIFASKGDLIKG